MSFMHYSEFNSLKLIKFVKCKYFYDFEKHCWKLNGVHKFLSFHIMKYSVSVRSEVSESTLSWTQQAVHNLIYNSNHTLEFTTHHITLYIPRDRICISIHVDVVWFNNLVELDILLFMAEKFFLRKENDIDIGKQRTTKWECMGWTTIYVKMWTEKKWHNFHLKFNGNNWLSYWSRSI